MDWLVISRITNKNYDVAAHNLTEELRGPALGQVGAPKVGTRQYEFSAVRTRVFLVNTTMKIDDSVEVVVTRQMRQSRRLEHSLAAWLSFKQAIEVGRDDLTLSARCLGQSKQKLVGRAIHIGRWCKAFRYRRPNVGRSKLSFQKREDSISRNESIDVHFLSKFPRLFENLAGVTVRQRS